jgi:hypothetical protein
MNFDKSLIKSTLSVLVFAPLLSACNTVIEVPVAGHHIGRGRADRAPGFRVGVNAGEVPTGQGVPDEVYNGEGSVINPLGGEDGVRKSTPYADLDLSLNFKGNLTVGVGAQHLYGIWDLVDYGDGDMMSLHGGYAATYINISAPQSNDGSSDSVYSLGNYRGSSQNYNFTVLYSRKSEDSRSHHILYAGAGLNSNKITVTNDVNNTEKTKSQVDPSVLVGVTWRKNIFEVGLEVGTLLLKQRDGSYNSPMTYLINMAFRFDKQKKNKSKSKVRKKRTH